MKTTTGSAALLGIGVFLAGMVLTAVAAVRIRNLSRAESAVRFERLADRLTDTVQRRMNQAIYGLRGIRGFFGGSENVSREEFRRFVDTYHFESDFPGVLGFGFIQRVPRAELDAFVAAVRADGAPDFAVRPDPGSRSELYVIKFVEPLATNKEALGFDHQSDPTRAAAIERAVRTGDATLTARVVLPQDPRRRPGFLFLLPLFRRGQDPGTPETRAADVIGMAYAPIIVDTVLAGVIADVDDLLDLEVFEGTELSHNALLFDSDGSLHAADRPAPFPDRMFNRIGTIEFSGRQLTLAVSSTPRFETGAGTNTTAFVVSGALVSALLAAVVVSLGTGRARALAIAEERTASLRASEAEARRLAVVASRTNNGVIIADASDRVEWINEGFTRMTGYTLDEIRGRVPGSFLQGPQTDPATVATMREALAAGRGFNVELLNYDKGGRAYWIALEVQVLRDPDGAVTGFMSIVNDITARRAADRELQLLNAQLAEAGAISRDAAARADQANRAKSQFLATMSHEIRTPMNGVIGMTSLLLDTDLDPQQREYAEIVRTSGENLLSLINDILDFSKIESGRMELENESFGVRDCVESSLDLFGLKAAQQGVDVLYEFADDVPQNVRGDVTRVRQILVNLIGNALKFTERGEVELRVRRGQADAGRIGLVFSVRDTGIGIPAEAQDRLFKSFTQVDASTSRRYGGTGLGLAISKRLAEIMGGRMWLESAPGKGSTFSFSIEVEPAPDSPAAPGARDPADLAGKRLLIVDNNETSRRILSTIATKAGITAAVESGGAAALQRIVAGEKFDCAILDMQMPEMDGPALAREIRRRHGLADFPLILLSSIGRPPAAEVAGLFNRILTKPVKPAVLLETIAGVASEAGADAPAVVAGRTAPSRSERILLAEDNPINQKVAIHLLARLGYRADTVANGAEAIEATERRDYDVILMDMQMPEMDGIHATGILRAKKPVPGRVRPWIIALTANALSEDRERCIAAGMDDFLSKPIKAGDLAAALERARPRSAT